MEPPTSIVTDDHDTIIFRDVHWLQFHCENAQDVFDTTLQAYRVAEDHQVLLPAFVTYAGWEVSHASFPLTLGAAKRRSNLYTKMMGQMMSRGMKRRIVRTRLTAKKR